MNISFYFFAALTWFFSTMSLLHGALVTGYHDPVMITFYFCAVAFALGAGAFGAMAKLAIEAIIKIVEVPLNILSIRWTNQPINVVVSTTTNNSDCVFRPKEVLMSYTSKLTAVIYVKTKKAVKSSTSGVTSFIANVKADAAAYEKVAAEADELKAKIAELEAAAKQQ